MQPLDLSSELPPQRDDEPSSLRADIFDELADHLECSLQRERVKTSDEDIALRNVIEKFGNPASVAFKLWRDAMWEKQVMQKFMTAGAGGVFVLAVIASLIIWQAAAAANRHLQEQADQQQALITALLVKLNSPVNPGPAPLPGWRNVAVKLLDEDGQPARGEVTLTRPIQHLGESTGGEEIVQRRRGLLSSLKWKVQTDHQGVADFGELPDGNYLARIFNTDSQTRLNTELQVRPGQPSFEFRSPMRSFAENRFAFTVSPPTDLLTAPLHYVLFAWPGDERTIDQQVWRFQGSILCLLDSQGKPIGRLSEEFVRYNSMRVWKENSVQAPVDIKLPSSRLMVGMLPAVRLHDETLLHLRFDSTPPSPPQGNIVIAELPDFLYTINGDEYEVLTPGADGQFTLRIPENHRYWERVRAWIAAPKLQFQPAHFENGLLVIE